MVQVNKLNPDDSEHERNYDHQTEALLLMKNQGSYKNNKLNQYDLIIVLNLLCSNPVWCGILFLCGDQATCGTRRFKLL